MSAIIQNIFLPISMMLHQRKVDAYERKKQKQIRIENENKEEFMRIYREKENERMQLETIRKELYQILDRKIYISSLYQRNVYFHDEEVQEIERKYNIQKTDDMNDIQYFAKINNFAGLCLQRERELSAEIRSMIMSTSYPEFKHSRKVITEIKRIQNKYGF